MTHDDRRYLVAGDRAVLVELADLDAALGFFARLGALQASDDAIPGVGELLPAARTVLVEFQPWRIARADLVRRLDAVSSEGDGGSAGELVEIPVAYDGEDLAEVASLLGMTPDEVVRRHTASEFTAAFAGFAPGFVYLVGGDPAFEVPRRPTPRTRIPGGSVALAGAFSGVYPRESPGGWQLIGTTALAMWDVDRERPAAVRPGDRVRFVETPGGGIRPRVRTAEPAADAGGPALIVTTAGLRTVFQDEGRPGLGALGVSVSGALDAPALRLANRLVGSRTDAAVLEIPFGGLRATARGACVVAVTGARVPVTVARADGSRVSIADQRAVALDDGDTLTLGAPTSGMRAVLAVRGGFARAGVLGSLATDTLAGLGPEPVRDGDVLEIGDAAAGSVAEPQPWPAHATDVVELPVDLGPRDDWFDAASLALLTDQEWTITAEADRVGLRLAGETPLTRAVEGELPSEGAANGSIQVPPSGQPMVFLADHPMTGGYPIVGVVRHDALPLLAQATPGMRIRFRLQNTPTKEHP